MKRYSFLIIFIASVQFATAQHEHHMAMQDSTAGHMAMQNKQKMHMGHSYSLNLPMNRNGSGTGWLPDNSPMYGAMYHARQWMYMLHGNIALRYTKQDLTNKGARGGEKFDAPNWLMFMGQRRVGYKGLFHFSTMLSLDRITEGGEGYPLLFQTGESWKGVPLVDKQHPHDLFSELSVGYTHSFSKRSDLTFYVGYPGEPALGSVAFMHRPSALENPDAPLSHHWNDGTHITFGVATIGYRYGQWKLEASSFTGREPNENRYNFDKPRFDSWSGRLSFAPSKSWSLQVSHGFIKDPEILHAGEDVNRTTASAIYSNSLGKNNLFNASVLWGVNKTKGHTGENAVLLEASSRWNRLAVYGRFEWVQKSTEELNLLTTIYGHTTFGINALTAGANYDVITVARTRFALGAQASIYKAPTQLHALYGNSPIGLQVFLRIYPSLMN